MNKTFNTIYNMAIEKVPAYRRFLMDTMNLIPAIPEQYHLIPLTDKKNYINRYPLNELCIDGTLHDKHIICRSSGTTRKPTYWPQLPSQEQYVDYYIYSDLSESFHIEHNPVLAIVALGLGSWISGELTTWGLRNLGIKKKNLTLFTPGINEHEILEALSRFSPHYKYTVIYSYPPYAKRIIDLAEDQNIPVKDYNINFRLAGEGYSENYRDYINQKLGYAPDNIHTILSGYGSADFGSLGKETLLCAAIKRILHKNPEITTKLFGSTVIPTICQYDPGTHFLEEVDQELVVTKNQAIPLLRYRTSDRGEIIEFNDMISIIQRYGTDPLEYARKLNVSPQSIQNLPFVIVYGRMDGGITVYGANVLVYQIKEALERSAFLTEYFTGNFFMKKTEDSDLNPIFEIYLELRNDEIIPDAHITSQEIYLNLKTISAEYNALSESLGEKTMPVVKFLTNGSFLDTHKIRYTK